jgi:hypothetical protein
MPLSRMRWRLEDDVDLVEVGAIVKAPRFFTTRIRRSCRAGAAPADALVADLEIGEAMLAELGPAPAGVRPGSAATGSGGCRLRMSVR